MGRWMTRLGNSSGSLQLSRISSASIAAPIESSLGTMITPGKGSPFSSRSYAYLVMVLTSCVRAPARLPQPSPKSADLRFEKVQYLEPGDNSVRECGDVILLG